MISTYLKLNTALKFELKVKLITVIHCDCPPNELLISLGM